VFRVERLTTPFWQWSKPEQVAGICRKMHYIAIAKTKGEIKRVNPVQKIHLSFADRLCQYISSKEFSLKLIAPDFEMIRLST
jgi:hypothetical protein